MKILIVDDERLARQQLERLLGDIGPPYEMVGEATNGAVAIEQCARKDVDLVLMDIRMPVMDGLEAAARLMAQDPPPAVIFTTAYDEHALTAFERNAVDYLLKPVRKERLKSALDRARSLTRPQLQALDAFKELSDVYVYANFRGGVLRIPVTEVYFFHAEQKYVVARHQGGETLLEDSLKSLEQLVGNEFLRIHRNALVAKSYLSGLEKRPDGRCWVQFNDIEDRLEVSRRHLPGVRRWLKGGGE